MSAWKPADEAKFAELYKKRATNDELIAQFDTTLNKLLKYIQREQEAGRLSKRSELAQVDDGLEWFTETDLPEYDKYDRMEGDRVIFADSHVPFYSAKWSNRMLAMARRYDMRRFTVVGDAQDMQAFSHWEKSPDLPWTKEELASGHWWWTLYNNSDEIELLPANHEKRAVKATEYQTQVVGWIDGILTAYARHTGQKLLFDPSKLKVSSYSYSLLDNEWLLLHPKRSSVHILNIANQLAQRYGRSVMCAHEHKTSIGYSRCGQHMLMSIGGLFDERKMAWRHKDLDTAPAWSNGFVIYRNGHAQLYGDEPFTDWSLYEGVENA
jgi:hypothetical protein